MKKCITLLSVIIILLLSSSYATTVFPLSNAKPSFLPATGTITDSGATFTSVRTVGSNTIMTGTETQTYTGTFSGSAQLSFELLMHSSGTFDAILIASFAGSADGKSGIVKILYVAHAEGFGLHVTGYWVILRGIGDLANIHGQGTFEGSAGISQTYTGQIKYNS